VVYPQLRIKAGANVHLKINYEGCNGLRPCDIQGMMQNNSFNEATATTYLLNLLRIGKNKITCFN
jgi:hypothetical protein